MTDSNSRGEMQLSGPARVLVVDDFAPGRYSKARLLRSAGFDVIEAASGAEALALASSSVCAVLLDVNLPDMSGLEVARRIKSTPEFLALPVIQISAVRTETADLVAGLEQGADAYLVDPVEPALLIATVRSFARARAAEVRVSRAAAEWEATFQSVTEPIALVNESGRVYRANRHFEQLFGISVAEASGAVALPAPLAERFSTLFGAEPDGGNTGEFVIGSRIFAARVDFFEKSSMPGAILSLRDITEQREEQRKITALQEQSERIASFYMTVTDAIAEGVVAMNGSGAITFANPAAAQMLGHRRETLIGRSFHEVAHGSADHQDESRCALHQVLRSGASYRVESDSFRRADGLEVSVSYAASPLLGESRISGAVVVFHDVTERRKLETALQLRADELEREGRERDEFFGLVSHELRTPMTAILGWTQLLRATQGDANEELTLALRSIESSARVQERLVSDMLDATRLATGKLSLNLSTIPVCELLQQVVNGQTPAADLKKIRIVLEKDPTDPRAHGDLERLRQIFGNLLSNAVKFTPREGTVTISVRSDDRCVHVSVADTGEGISPEFLPRIFEKFYQTQTGQQAGGLGLGLSIVRTLVEAHGGSVSASSAGKGKGATFTVALPLSVD